MQDVPAQWQTAAAAIQRQLGVTNVTAVVPLAPAEMSTLTAAPISARRHPAATIDRRRDTGADVDVGSDVLMVNRSSDST